MTIIHFLGGPIMLALHALCHLLLAVAETLPPSPTVELCKLIGHWVLFVLIAVSAVIAFKKAVRMLTEHLRTEAPAEVPTGPDVIEIGHNREEAPDGAAAQTEAAGQVQEPPSP